MRTSFQPFTPVLPQYQVLTFRPLLTKFGSPCFCSFSLAPLNLSQFPHSSFTQVPVLLPTFLQFQPKLENSPYQCFFAMAVHYFLLLTLSCWRRRWQRGAGSQPFSIKRSIIPSALPIPTERPLPPKTIHNSQSSPSLFDRIRFVSSSFGGTQNHIPSPGGFLSRNCHWSVLAIVKIPRTRCFSHNLSNTFNTLRR